MAGNHGSEYQFTGWQKTFNSYTPRGRLHCGYASIAFWASIFVVVKFWPKKAQEPKAIKSGQAS